MNGSNGTCGEAALDVKEKAKAIYSALRQSQYIPEAVKEWKQYRTQLTDYIIGSTSPGTTLAVFGAGQLADIDLGKLVKHFARIALLDVDRSAMEKACQRCMKENADSLLQRVELYEIDFVGISEQKYLDFTESLIRDASGGEALALLERAYGERKDYQPEKKIPGRYDYVVSIGVHSQLNNTFAWLIQTVKHLRRESLGGCTESLLGRVRRESAAIVKQYDDLLFATAIRGIFFGCEKCRVRREESRDEDVWSELADTEVDGAWQALCDARYRADTGECSLTEYFDTVWPFSYASDTFYRMLVLRLQKQGGWVLQI